MSEPTTPLEYERLTQLLETHGIDDAQVSGARTVTIGTALDTASPGETATEFVTRLPRLVDQPEDSQKTLAELELKGTLGKGGMGHVHLAEQLSLGRDVAVKQVRDRSRCEETTLVLLREGWATGALEHPNIVPVHTMGRDADGEPMIVMKKIAGTPWLEIIEDDDRIPDGFDADDEIELHIDVLTQICNAVHYAHSQGIVHRDLKPENVMLGEFGEVYVLDWGIAVSVDGDCGGRMASADEVDEPVGTPAYMAPEMVDVDDENIGRHTDVFLLGAMLYEALTGEPPHRGKTVFQMMFAAHRCEPPTFDESVPPQLAAICKKAMARDPDDRYDSARAFRQALHTFRSNREARRLARQGRRRLQKLRSLVESEETEEFDERMLYTSFSESRFAFEQSLKIDPDSAQARQGLQQALELMADRALRQEAYKAASLLIADFPQPNERFANRLETLGKRLDEREADFETLQKLKHDVDVEVGRSSRAIFATGMALFWALFSLAMAIVVEFGFVTLTHTLTVGHSVVLAGIVAGVVYGGRTTLFKNDLNRRMLMAAVATFLCVIVHRTMAGLTDMAFRTAFSQEMLLYGVATLLVGMTLDRRLIWASMPFIGGAVAGAVFPEIAYWIYFPVNLVAMLIVFWVWGGEDKDAAASSPH